MIFKHSLAILVLASLAILLVACELSAAPPPATPATGEGPMATLQRELAEIATQTAMAGNVGAGTPPATPEPLPTNTAQEGAESPEATQPPEATPEPQEEPTPFRPTATPIVVPSPTPGIPETYTLQRGEFPFCIARRFNVDPGALLSANNLGLNSQPDVGFRLTIPQNAGPFPGDRSLQDHPDTYVVSSGDTIYSIACEYGDVSPEAIAAANGLEPPYELESGQEIAIP